MLRKFFCVAFVLAALSLLPVQAAELEVIPAGADLVLFVNNHSGLPLGDLLKSAPIPAFAREKMNEFFSATDFNPLENIKRAQLMLKKGAHKRDDHASIVLCGSFNKDKLLAFVKEKAGQALEEEKFGELVIYKGKDGKGGFCFIDNSKFAFGTLPALRAYFDARSGLAVSDEFNDLKSQLNDKAYVALMIGGRNFLKREMEKSRGRRRARMAKVAKGAVAKWLENYITEGVEPTGVFAQLLENSVEARLFYSRDGANNSIHASVEVVDPKIAISKLFGELVKVLPELPAHEPKQKAREKAPEKPSEKSRW